MYLLIVPQEFCILKNIYEFLHFFAPGSTVYLNTSSAIHLHCIWFSWKGKKQISTTIKINSSKTNFCNLALLALLLEVKETTRRK